MILSIPAFHVSDTSRVKGLGQVFIASRKDATSHGTFDVRVSVQFLGIDPYPSGTVLIVADLNDSAKGTFKSTSIELVNSYGKVNPTVYVTGRCQLDPPTGVAAPQGLRFWLMIASNKGSQETGTPDVVGFAVHDRTGARVAYGTGPLLPGGDFSVEAE